MPARGTSTRGRPAVRFIMPVLAAGIIVACVAVLLKPEPKRHTVSSVARDISRVALHKSQTPGVEDGGILGAWWISASGYDPIGGRFHNLVIKSGPIIIGAKTARLTIDPIADTFTFDLHDVVYTDLPSSSEEPETDGILERIDTLRLGPVKYDRDIVPDGGLSDDDHGASPPTTSIVDAG